MKLRKYIRKMGSGQRVYITKDEMTAYDLKKGDIVEITKFGNISLVLCGVIRDIQGVDVCL